MNEEACYCKKVNELRLDYNVKFEYLVFEEFEDGIIVQTVLIPKKIYDDYYVREDRIVK